MAKKAKKQEIVFYTLQPIDVEETDFRLHIRADTEQGIKQLKRWLHSRLYRRNYYYDRIAEYYTIKKNGKYVLGAMELSFNMVEGISEV